ncbi:metal-dependent hydrolase [Larkinella sp. GY13]|uniref:metal-dependent hydrolase n=1 Tax=Larkinella sp. GY13 TaxID=3453720 RepID=UPI003EEDE3F7
MQSFNHVAGGFAFTGLFASFADVNVYERFDTMAVITVATLLPDIDHTRSTIGKAVYPLARWLQRNYGHRTITHSIFFYAAVVLATRLLDNLFHLHYTLPVSLALGSHLIFDMCTRQGIPIFYPFSKRPAVLPANPKLRLSVNDYRAEVVVFLLFCCLNLFAFPLMVNGFWTKYNQSFNTFDHLERERLRKPGDYGATLLVNGDTVSGTVFRQTDSKLILYQGRDFKTCELNQCRLLSFKRLPTRHEMKEVGLFQIGIDSLNTWLEKPVVKVSVQSEREIHYYVGSIMKKGTEINMEFPNQTRFMQLEIDNRETQAQLKLLTIDYNAQRREYANKVLTLAELRHKLRMETSRKGTSDYDEGKRLDSITELSRKIDGFVIPNPPDRERYETQRAILKMKLLENDKLNAHLLIWHGQNYKTKEAYRSDQSL